MHCQIRVKCAHSAGVTLNLEYEMKILFATVVLAAMIASSAMAQTATQRARPQLAPAQIDPSGRAASTYDGRVEGQPRTCEHYSFQYDSEGTPTGPYCH